MIIVEKLAKAVHESICGDCLHLSDTAYALRYGKEPLLLEEIKFNAAGFDAIQITSKGNRSSVEFDTPYPTLCKDGNPHVITLHPEIAPTLTASAGGTSRPGGGQGNELDYYMAYSIQGNMIGRADHNGPRGSGINENNSFTLNATDLHAVAFFNHTHNFNCPKHGEKASCQTARQYKKTPVDLVVQLGSGQEVAGTILAQSGERRFSGNQEIFSGNFHVVEFSESTPHYVVRRLTPTECERLQGFSDGWTKHGTGSGKEIADTPRYQMLGNSVAIPVVRFILGNIAEMEKEKAMTGKSHIEKPLKKSFLKKSPEGVGQWHM